MTAVILYQPHAYPKEEIVSRNVYSQKKDTMTNDTCKNDVIFYVPTEYSK